MDPCGTLNSIVLFLASSCHLCIFNLLGLRYCSYQSRALSLIPNFLSRISSSRLWLTVLKAAIITAVMFLFTIPHSVSFVSLSRLVSQLKFFSVS